MAQISLLTHVNHGAAPPCPGGEPARVSRELPDQDDMGERNAPPDRKSTRLNSSHSQISYAVFCLKKKKNKTFLVLQRTSARMTQSVPLLSTYCRYIASLLFESTAHTSHRSIVGCYSLLSVVAACC